MKCPNCNREAADTEEECTCGLVLTKWRNPPKAAAPAPAPAARPAAPAPAADGGNSLTGLLVVGALLIGAVWYSLHGSADDASDQGGSASVAGTQNCAFSGEVVDIYSLEGVRGARVDFGPKAVRQTDASGHYWIRVKPSRKYNVAVAQPKYLPEYIEGFGRDWREAPLDQRVHAARAASDGTAHDLENFECSAGDERIFNFALVPKVPPADLKAQIDAVQ